MCARSKTLLTCAEVEDRLARESVNFEINIENNFIQAMQTISEVKLRIVPPPGHNGGRIMLLAHWIVCLSVTVHNILKTKKITISV